MRNHESLWIGVGVGCSLLLLCGLCILGAASVWWFRTASAMEVPPPPPYTAPPPWVPPTTPIAPPTAPPLVGPATPLAPGGTTGTDLRRVRATITESEGLADVAVGASCVADVTRHDHEDGTFWCNAQVTCGSRLLYGGADAGFFQCVLYDSPRRDVVGSDANTTAEDRDAAFSLNTVGGSLEIRDDASGTHGAMHVLAHVDAVE
jgi:hypothetical protein